MLTRRRQRQINSIVENTMITCFSFIMFILPSAMILYFASKAMGYNF